MKKLNQVKDAAPAPDAAITKPKRRYRIGWLRDSEKPGSRERRLMGRKFQMDNGLSAEDWKAVYEAYGKTGLLEKLGELTGLARPQVTYLLDVGIERLGLRPIREASTDYNTVNVRASALMEPGGLPSEKLAQKREVEEAATSRAVRETVAAQSVLQAAVRTTDVLLGYAEALLAKVKSPDGGYDLPEKVRLTHILSLTQAINSLANATSKAIEQSRLTAGEPTQHIAVQVGAFVAAMEPTELRRFVSTGELPTHLLSRGGSRDPVEDGPSKVSSLPVIEGELADE